MAHSAGGIFAFEMAKKFGDGKTLKLFLLDSYLPPLRKFVSQQDILRTIYEPLRKLAIMPGTKNLDEENMELMLEFSMMKLGVDAKSIFGLMDSYRQGRILSTYRFLNEWVGNDDQLETHRVIFIRSSGSPDDLEETWQKFFLRKIQTMSVKEGHFEMLKSSVQLIRKFL